MHKLVFLPIRALLMMVANARGIVMSVLMVMVTMRTTSWRDATMMGAIIVCMLRWMTVIMTVIRSMTVFVFMFMAVI